MTFTAQQAKDLMAFVEETQFERVGAFTYSPQEGTRAHAMTDDVPDAIKRERDDAAPVGRGRQL